jgi:hypothetical protein
MQISWRRNPKTEDGWFKRLAIALLSGVASFALSFPLSFILLLSYMRRSNPAGTETTLSAMTSAVVIGLTFAALAFVASISILWLLSFRNRPQPAE